MLGEHMLQTLQYAWQNLLHPPYKISSPPIQPSGLVIPHSGSLWFTLVQSRQLARKYMFPLTDIDAEDCTKAFANISLKDNTVGNFQPLRFQNMFVKLDEPYDTERMQMLSDCAFLTESCQLFDINFNNPEQIEKCLGCENQCSFEVTCIADGYFHAIVAWFQVYLDEDIYLCSAPDDPNADTCCWDQAVFPCHRAVHVVPGCKILLSSDWARGKMTFRAEKITYPDGRSCFMQTEAMKVPSSFVSMLNDTNLLEHLRIAALKFLEDFQEREDGLSILDSFPVPVFGLTVLRNLHLVSNRLKKEGEVTLLCIVESEDAAELIRKMAEYNGIPGKYLLFISEDDSWQDKLNSFDAVILNFLDREGDLNEKIMRPEIS